MGGRITPTLLYATSKFHNDNPKTFKVFFDALQWIESHKAEAAETYFRVEQSKLDPAFVKSVFFRFNVVLIALIAVPGASSNRDHSVAGPVATT